MTAQELQQRLKQKFGKCNPAKGDWLRIPCPTCAKADKNKMKRYVSTTSDYTKCFICCKNHIKTSTLLNSDVAFVFDYSASVKEKEPENALARVMPGSKFEPITELSMDHPAVKFLHKDHLLDLARYYSEYGVVYCPVDGGTVLYNKPYTTSAERIIFPVRFHGQMIGWQMRSIPGTFYGDRVDVIRYIHLFPKGEYLFNYDNARKQDVVIVVEGIKKALKLPSCAVATLGKGVSATQLQLLLSWKNIIVMLDADKNEKDTTQAEARKLTEGLISAGKRAININLGNYGIPSPDEATQDQLADIVYVESKKL